MYVVLAACDEEHHHTFLSAVSDIVPLSALFDLFPVTLFRLSQRPLIPVVKRFLTQQQTASRYISWTVLPPPAPRRCMSSRLAHVCFRLHRTRRKVFPLLFQQLPVSCILSCLFSLPRLPCFLTDCEVLHPVVFTYPSDKTKFLVYSSSYLAVLVACHRDHVASTPIACFYHRNKFPL